jgi:hypothetical protein
LAVRLSIEGRSPIHRRLAAEPITWTSRIRSVASDVGVGRIWVEKVQLRTSPEVEGPPAEGPIAELLQWIAQRPSAPEQSAALSEEVSDLVEKLPSELREGADALGLDRPERFGELVQQAEQLLAQRLLDRGTPP